MLRMGAGKTPRGAPMCGLGEPVTWSGALVTEMVRPGFKDGGWRGASGVAVIGLLFLFGRSAGMLWEAPLGSEASGASNGQPWLKPKAGVTLNEGDWKCG